MKSSRRVLVGVLLTLLFASAAALGRTKAASARTRNSCDNTSCEGSYYCNYNANTWCFFASGPDSCNSRNCEGN